MDAKSVSCLTRSRRASRSSAMGSTPTLSILWVCPFSCCPVLCPLWWSLLKASSGERVLPGYSWQKPSMEACAGTLGKCIHNVFFLIVCVLRFFTSQIQSLRLWWEENHFICCKLLLPQTLLKQLSFLCLKKELFVAPIHIFWLW